MAHQAPVRFDPVMRPRDLPRQIVEGLDPDVIRIKGEDPGDLPGGTRRSWGTIRRTFSASFQAGSTTETWSLPTSGSTASFFASRAVVTWNPH